MADLNQNKIRKSAGAIKTAAYFLIAGILIFHLWVWVDPLGAFARSGFELTTNSETVKTLTDEGLFSAERLTFQVRAVGFLISAVPMAMIVLVLIQVANLMGTFMAGIYISTKGVKALARASFALILYPFASIVSESLLILYLTKDNAVGERLFSISINGSDAMILFLGGALWMITRAFDVEKERAEEHASII